MLLFLFFAENGFPFSVCFSPAFILCDRLPQSAGIRWLLYYQRLQLSFLYSRGDRPVAFLNASPK